MYFSNSDRYRVYVTLQCWQNAKDLTEEQVNQFTPTSYRWGIMMCKGPDLPDGIDYRFFTVTDEVQTVRRTESSTGVRTEQMTNTDRQWILFFCGLARYALGKTLVVRFRIGRQPRFKRWKSVYKAFNNNNKVPLPRKGTEPEETSVDWIRHAIRYLQGRGWAAEFDIDAFVQHAKDAADRRLMAPEQSDLDQDYLAQRGIEG